MNRRRFGTVAAAGSLGVAGLVGPGCQPQPTLGPPTPGNPRDFVTLWRPGRAEPEGDGDPLDHAAGDHYGPVGVGETVWFVSVRAGRLELYGRLVVGAVTDRDGAARALGAGDLVHASYHLLAAPGTARRLAIRDVHPLAPCLRFTDPAGPDRLALTPDGLVTAPQLLPLRLPTVESVGLLREALGGAG